MAKESRSTEDLLEIADIKKDTVILKNGGLRKIFLVSGVNFDLKSEEEQGLILYGYQSFLNTLNFSIEQIVLSRKINVENYLQLIDNRSETEKNRLLQSMIKDYRKFVADFVAQNAIMEKIFFVVVPYDPIQLPLPKNWLDFFHKEERPPEGEKQDFETNLGQLNQRADEVVSGLTAIGLRVVPLAEQEITELFYGFYNQ